MLAVDPSSRYLPYWSQQGMHAQVPWLESRPHLPATSAQLQTGWLRKEMDDLARKQEEFILRCQYPKRILPSELKAQDRKGLYSERRRERSESPSKPKRRYSPWRKSRSPAGSEPSQQHSKSK